MANLQQDECVTQLLENEPQVLEAAVQTLLRIMNNIENNERIEKYRRIKLSSATVTNKLLPANGALACLFAAGFIEVSYNNLWRQATTIY